MRSQLSATRALRVWPKAVAIKFCKALMTKILQKETCTIPDYGTGRSIPRTGCTTVVPKKSVSGPCSTDRERIAPKRIGPIGRGIFRHLHGFARDFSLHLDDKFPPPNVRTNFPPLSFVEFSPA